MGGLSPPLRTPQPRSDTDSGISFEDFLRVLSLAVLAFRGDLTKDAELLVLRHENAVPRRHAGRVRYEPADRAWFAALARLANSR